MATFRGEIDVLDAEGNPITIFVELEINEEISQQIKIDYLSASDGGPVMRPAKPPKG
jgi:hypothetical protein